MTISSSAVSLATYANMSNNPLVSAFAYSLISNNNVIQDIPLQTNASLLATGSRFDGSNYPTVNWSQINAEGVTVNTTPTPWQEGIFLLRNYIDVDKLLVKDKNAIRDPRAAQTEAYSKFLTYEFNNRFINNDHITGNVNAPVGLKYRVANGTTYGVWSNGSIDAGGVDLSQSGISAATANKFLELLDQTLWSVDSVDGSGVVLYMNEVMKRRFAFALRQLGTNGGYSIMQDQFNRTVEMYKGARVVDIGYQPNQTTRIIPTVENAAGASSGGTFTSIYAVNYSEGHFGGWQFDDLNVQDLGLLNNGVTYRTLIDWAIGYYNDSTHSIARLYDIKLA